MKTKNTCEHRKRTGMKKVIYCKVAQCNFAEKTCNECFRKSCHKVSEIIGEPVQLSLRLEFYD